MVELFGTFFEKASAFFDLGIPGLNVSFFEFFIGFLFVKAALSAVGKILGNQ